MIRKVLLPALVLSLSAGALAAQTTAPTPPPAKASAKPATPAHAMAAPHAAAAPKTDSTKHSALNSMANVKLAQRALKKDGLYKGKITGRVSQDFSNALTSYQTKNGLTASGELDSATLDKLKASAPAHAAMTKKPAAAPATTPAADKPK